MLGRVALVGMPNVGKTALFNKLTGSYQRVANFPGVTVEKKMGWINEGEKKLIEVVDLPGLYSLDATTFEEKITKDYLLKKDEEIADLFILVVDATHLEKSLYLAIQLKRLGYPLILALNLMDEANRRGLELDLDLLKKELGAVIIPTSAATGGGIDELIAALKDNIHLQKEIKVQLPTDTQKEFRSTNYVRSIFSEIDSLLKKVVKTPMRADSFSEWIDHWVLHPVWGGVILIGVLLIMFQALFTWAAPLQDGIESLLGVLGEWVAPLITQDTIRSLIVDGIINGVGGVLVFLPQIALLFLFIQFLEDFGYLGRAAFLMDALMRRLGLPGKAVIPLLSSHACAIPGIMSTRVMENPRERLITMLVIPLTTCSARLPVYALLIGALIPDTAVSFFPFFRWPGLVLFMLYFMGFASSLIVAFLFKKFLPHESPSMLLMELPPYRVPKFKNLFMVMKNKSQIFITKAGTIILGFTVLVWFLVSFPGQGVEESYAAFIGKFFEPLFRPLGFDWRMTTALIPSIGAREVMVSAMSMVLSIQEGSAGFENQMQETLLSQFGAGTLSALLVWFIFAPQCVSTIAILKRETASWKWPLVMVFYTLAMSYGFAWLTKIIVG